MSLVNQAENIPMRLLRICRLKIFQNVVCVLGVWTLAGQSRKQVLESRVGPMSQDSVTHRAELRIRSNDLTPHAFAGPAQQPAAALPAVCIGRTGRAPISFLGSGHRYRLGNGIG